MKKIVLIVFSMFVMVISSGCTTRAEKDLISELRNRVAAVSTENTKLAIAAAANEATLKELQQSNDALRGQVIDLSKQNGKLAERLGNTKKKLQTANHRVHDERLQRVAAQDTARAAVREAHRQKVVVATKSARRSGT